MKKMPKKPPARPSIDFNQGPGFKAVKDLQAGARAAMANNDGAAAIEAIRKLEDLIPATNDIRRRVYNSLMSDAITYGCLPAIDDLLGKSQTHYASGMAHAAQIDQIDSFNHFVESAAKTGFQLPDIDLQVTLVMAAEHGSRRVLYALLDMGVDPHIHGDRPMQYAIKRYERDGFEPVEKLLRHGADHAKALAFAAEFHPDDQGLAKRIAGFPLLLQAEKTEAAKELPSAGKPLGHAIIAPAPATFRRKQP